MFALLRGACLSFMKRVEIILLIFHVGFARADLLIQLLQAVQAFRCLWLDVVVLRAGS